MICYIFCFDMSSANICSAKYEICTRMNVPGGLFYFYYATKPPMLWSTKKCFDLFEVYDTSKAVK